MKSSSSQPEHPWARMRLSAVLLFLLFPLLLLRKVRRREPKLVRSSESVGPDRESDGSSLMDDEGKSCLKDHCQVSRPVVVAGAYGFHSWFDNRAVSIRLGAMLRSHSWFLQHSFRHLFINPSRDHPHINLTRECSVPTGTPKSWLSVGFNSAPGGGPGI